jgi:hypothetical protein
MPWFTGPIHEKSVASDIIETIGRLARLRQESVLTEEEFAAKKAELLQRL